MLIRLGGLFFLISMIFWLWALFDSVTADRARIRSLPKWAWIVLILLFLEVGALAWLLLGRPRAGRHDGGPARTTFGGSNLGRGGSGGSGARRGTPVGPDDDPDFLRGLSKPQG